MQYQRIKGKGRPSKKIQMKGRPKKIFTYNYKEINSSKEISADKVLEMMTTMPKNFKVGKISDAEVDVLVEVPRQDPEAPSCSQLQVISEQSVTVNN